MIINTNTDVIFIWNRKKEKESKTAERPRKRECERGRVVALVVKMTVEENGPFGIRIGLRR
jgi:hypothetical protein